MTHCFWCGEDCGAQCLNLSNTQMNPDDPAYFLLNSGSISTSNTYDENCYICRDPEFAQMGLPLCYACEGCGKHVAADAGECENEECDYDRFTEIAGL